MIIQRNTNRLERTYWSTIPVTVAILIFIFARASGAETRPEPFNKVVIIIDSSGSYRSRQTEAIDKTIALLDDISGRKLHRWEPASDQVTLISLDAIPEVLWEGSLHDLKTMEPSFWTARFRARTDYAGCTDVAAAFRLAVQHLEGDPRYIRKYLFVFSDLIDEPPADSIYRSRQRSRLPLTEFPWKVLKDVSVSVFWLPPEQKLAWSREVSKYGLSSKFALYTTSESAQVTIQPPPRATIEVTEEQRTANRENYMNSAMRLGKTALIILGIMILFPTIIYIGMRFSRRGRSARIPASHTVRPLHQSNVRRPGTPPPSGPRPMRPGQDTPFRNGRHQ